MKEEHKLRGYIILVLNWLWHNDNDKNEICDEIYDSVRDNFYLNECVRKKGHLYADDVQTAVCEVLKSRIVK